MIAELILRLFIAGLLGSLIGFEREYHAKEAGYRTHFLVALGSALLMILSQYGFDEVLLKGLVRLDPSRVAAGVVTGISFLGAGTIIFQKQVVHGLTTAAGIWATAGIGMAVGSGMYILSIAATLLVLAGLELLRLFFRGVDLRSSQVEFFTSSKERVKYVIDILSTKNYKLVSYELEEKDGGYVVKLLVKILRKEDETLLLSRLQNFEDVLVRKFI